MKQKIITALKTKYQRFGLSNEAIDRIASAKEKTVTKEEEIETAIADAETMELIANELQKSADKERRDKATLQKSFDEYKTKHPEEDDPKDPPEDDPNEPKWAKELRESNARIEARFKAEEDEKKNSELRKNIEEKLKAAGCTNPGILKLTLKGFALLENEDEDAAVERLKGEYNASYKEAFGEGTPPGVGTPHYENAKEAADAKNEFLREQGLLPKEK